MPLALPKDLMVGVSGFRGIAGEVLTPELAAGLGARYGTFLRSLGAGKKVVVGRDSRTTGPLLQRAVVAGLLSAGADVIEVGVVPTPTAMLAVGALGAAGGIVITASHNPAQWNALKFAERGGVFLSPDRMDRFLEEIRRGEPYRAPWDEVGAAAKDDAATKRHLDAILSLELLDLPRIRARRAKVALDCVHGAGGAPMVQLLEELGCRVFPIGVAMHGRFGRDPEPTAENLGDLSSLVLSSRADIGLATDPDADRLSLVDERGAAIGEDYTLALAADVALRVRPGPLVCNLSTSRVVLDAAARRGCPAHMAAVGEIHVARRMMEAGAVIGGEGNGGVILPELHYTRDALVAAALALQSLASSPRPLSARIGELPSYRIVKRKVRFPREKSAGAHEALERAFPGGASNRADGLRIDWEDKREWLHVRPSGTEPVVRIISEAPQGARAEALASRAERILEEIACAASSGT